MVLDFDCWHPYHDAVTVQDITGYLPPTRDKAKGLVARLPRIPRSITSRVPKGGGGGGGRFGPRARNTALITRPGSARSVAFEKARRVAGRFWGGGGGWSDEGADGPYGSELARFAGAPHHEGSHLYATTVQRTSS